MPKITADGGEHRGRLVAAQPLLQPLVEFRGLFLRLPVLREKLRRKHQGRYSVIHGVTEGDYSPNQWPAQDGIAVLDNFSSFS